MLLEGLGDNCPRTTTLVYSPISVPRLLKKTLEGPLRSILVFSITRIDMMQ